MGSSPTPGMLLTRDAIGFHCWIRGLMKFKPSWWDSRLLCGAGLPWRLEEDS